MVKVLLISTNQRETEVLSLAFQQKSMKVIASQPTYSNYIRCLQYMPDILLMEMAQAFNEQIYFVRLLRKNKRTAKVPVLSYGNHTDNTVIKQFFLHGVNKYYPRPIRFGDILLDFGALLKSKGVMVSEKAGADKQSRAEDIALILNKEKMASDKLTVMVNHIGKLMVFPFTINRILRIADDNKSGAPELAKVIKTDSAMTTTILKVANSVIFASRDRKIADIKEAVVRIGFRETKNIALSMTVMKLFTREERSAGYNRMDFWYHSLTVAVIAEKLAKTSGFKNTEEAFVAGLLHDFGVLLLDEFFSEIFEKAIDAASKSGASFVQAEKDLMGVCHTDLTARLFEGWNIPKVISDATIYQMEFALFKSDSDAELTKLVRILGVANVLAKALDVGKECDQWVQPVPDDILQELRVPAGFRGNFLSEVYAAITMYSRFLGLEPKPLPEPRPLQDDHAKVRLQVVSKSRRIFDPHLLYVGNLGYPLVADPQPLPAQPPAGSQAAAEAKTAAAAEEKPDLIVLNADESTLLKDIEPVLALNRGVPGQKKPVPVLLFCDEKGEAASVPESGTLKKLPKTLDLRNIDFSIEKLLPLKPGA